MLLPDKTQILDFYHLILDLWLKMVEYSPVDKRIHHQRAVDHRQIMYIWILCQNVLSGNISFARNQDQKQNEVNHCLFPITMIVSIDFRPFSEWKSENFQKLWLEKKKKWKIFRKSSKLSRNIFSACWDHVVAQKSIF